MKNLILFFPPFLAGEMFQPGIPERGVWPFIAFCLASSSTYIVNDILDCANDSNHPVKKTRPLPSGEVKVTVAAFFAFVFAAGAITLSLKISTLFFVLLLAYLIISSLYSFKFKELPLVDICCISSGFLLRLQAGGEAFGIVISQWLFLSVFLLAIFLSTGKRYGEKKLLGETAGRHRKSLVVYPPGFLDGVLYLSGGAVLVTYTMYSLTRYPLVYTVPLCTFGLLRYLFRVKSGLDGDPTESLLKDFPLSLISLTWAIVVAWSIYS
ncbi:decaprenyl-phosphate phosphoribosyltransferase [Geobacter hydrogenophilus]|uniref:decaprenyl-phosphate phosphoribosyltransferase n=1 Tax=Geobacter hydrogenophilus TaxID=40983 RepID=UPI0031B85698